MRLTASTLGCTLSLVITAACAGTDTPTATPTTADPVADTADPTADAAVDPAFGPWQAQLHADHPLVGTAWSVGEARTLTRAELEQRVSAARLVLLGETHDHPDHHRLQGEMIATLVAGDQRPVVAYEMLEPEDQPAIDTFLASASRDPDAFAELVDWPNSGWPEWSLYRPAFAPVLEAALPILAAQVPRSETKRFMSEGLGILDPATVARFGLDQPLPDELQAAWLDEMFDGHCEMVPREHLAPMVEIQRIRDARMAEAMLAGLESDAGRSVLVAGAGHTRKAGVPRLLASVGVESGSVLSLGFVAVDPERSDPGDYGADFDVIVLTPGVEREDPCAAMRGEG